MKAINAIIRVKIYYIKLPVVDSVYEVSKINRGLIRNEIETNLRSHIPTFLIEKIIHESN